MKYRKFTLGEVEAVFNRHGGERGVRDFLRGETVVTGPRRFEEKKGVVYFEFRGDGTSGKDWSLQLQDRISVDGCAKSMLCSPEFKPGKEGVGFGAILRGFLFNDGRRTEHQVRTLARDRSLLIPSPDVACHIAESFSVDDMDDLGFHRLVVMHEEIIDEDGYPALLVFGRDADGVSLGSYFYEPNGDEWDEDDGFVFVTK